MKKKLSFLLAALLMSVGVFAQEIPFDQYRNVLLSDYSSYSDDATVTFVINNAGEKATGWGVAKIVPINNRGEGTDKYSFEIKNDPTVNKLNSYELTIAQLKEFAKMGGDYYTDSHGQQGISIDMWDGAELVSITVGGGDSPAPQPTGGFTFDFESDAVGATYAMKTHGEGKGTATVAANPTIASEKSLKVVVSDYNGRVKFNVTLPTGKTLADYTSLNFDTYWSLTGDERYKSMEIYINGTEFVKTDYILQGETDVWTPHTYPLAELPAALTSLNSFELQIGINIPAGEYYMDNIKFLDTPTGLSFVESESNILFKGDAIYLSQAADVEVYSLNGSVLKSGKNVQTMDISEVPSGIYIVKAIINGKVCVEKVVK